jgi:arylsulfatase
MIPFRRRFVLLVAAFATSAVATTSLAADAKGRPNIVMILADDLGYSDLGCYGSEIATPNLDKLAQRGVRLTQFYNQARCCPSRAVLMTGRYPHQVGVGAMIDGYAKWQRDAADRPSYTDHLSKDAPTVAELLKGEGYRTIMCGKWHLGDRPKEWPTKRGFDRSFALIPGAMNYYGGDTTGPRAPLVVDDQKFTPPVDGFFATDAFADRAIEFVKESKPAEQPFFLYMAFNAPHWPLHAPAEDIAKYAGTYDAGWQPIREKRFAKMKEMGILPADARMSPMDHEKYKAWAELSAEERKDWSYRMATYAAMVTRMDANIGRILGTIDQMGQAENTLVVFCSDNGGAAEDPNRSKPGAAVGTRDSFVGYARPWATVSNTPYKYHKVSAYEGGISSPFIAAYPAALAGGKRGAIVREPAHLIDLLPTFLQVAGAKETPKNLEGQSIAPMLSAEAGSADRTYFWEHEGNRAVRKGQYKLVSLPARPWELYDVVADRTESRNLAEERPEVVKELKGVYDEWAKRAGVASWEELLPHRPAARGGK